MTMRGRDLAQMPADTGMLGQKVLAANDPYRVIGDHLADLLSDEPFATMYETTGRQAVWPSLLAMVTLFQFLEKAPDREAARMVVTRLDWKYALHLPLDYLGFDFSILCDFRQRILAHGKEALIFETVLRKVQSLGFIKKRGKQRTDALAVIGAVRMVSHLETVTETLRVTVRALEQGALAWMEREVPASFREEYARSRSDYGLTEVERQAALEQVGQDGCWLLERLDAAAPHAVRALEAVTLLRTVWGQRYERVAGKVSVRTTMVDCTERIVTPHDPGVRAGEKWGKAWHGEKVHITETAEPDRPAFITDVTTANASSGDGEALPEIREHLSAREAPPAEQYVDSGYVSGKQMAASREAGIDLVGPPLADTSPNGLKIADFGLDRAAKVAICPAGQRSVKWCAHTERDGSAGVNIHFAATVCAGCPLRSRCTTGQGGRCIHVSERYGILEARRAEAKTDEFREKMRARPAIEATLSELVRGHGLRRHRYRGAGKRHLENLLKGTACNLKRLVRALVARWEREKRAGEAGSGELVAVASS